MEVSIEPRVLKWLIESSGWTKEEIAKRLRTSTSNIVEIELGRKKPSLRQLKELSKIFKRPLAAFLLSKPKHEKAKPKDYRMIPDKIGKFDKKTILVMRKARRLQELTRELSGNINQEAKSKLEKINISGNPEKIAGKFREKFNLTEEKQRKFKTSYELFNYLRDHFEDLNIYIFQFSMPVEDARGFVFVDENPKVIVVNTKDCIEARLFTLIHEFGHILLGESAIDLPDVTSTYSNKIEKWCNEFASSFLLPRDMARSIFESNKRILTKKESLKRFSNRYKISKAMLLLNMLKLKYITDGEYNIIISNYKKVVNISKQKSKKSRGGIPSDVKCMSEIGNKFVSLVANNYDRDHITYSDALNYLSIKSKNFDKVLSKAKK